MDYGLVKERLIKPMVAYVQPSEKELIVRVRQPVWNPVFQWLIMRIAVHPMQAY